jgi:hypothetical protein
VIIAAAPTLALRFTADNLLGTENRRDKETLTVRTTAGLAQADSSEDHWDGINEENRNLEYYARAKEKLI